MSEKVILITVDVEDWFQVENFRAWMPYTDWDSKEARVEQNTFLLLDILDSFPGKLKTRATFFILGWVARRFPGLVKEIYRRGHEVASHGYKHMLCHQLPKEDLRKDLIDSKKLLEDIVGASIQGYRAPNFSINHDILKMIEDSGYLYDSSYNSFGLNSRYGYIDLSGKTSKKNVYRISKSFYEIPISNLALLGDKFILPLGGGGYFRLLPYPIFKKGIDILLREKQAYLFYLHPWEVDSNQPKVGEASFFLKFRHYLNLNSTQSKLTRLLNDFRFCRFMTCLEMIQENKKTEA